MNKIQDLFQKFQIFTKTCQFVSCLYLSKKNEELVRYVLNIGGSYITLLNRSILELELQISELTGKENLLKYMAAKELLESLYLSLKSHLQNQQHPDYTKKGIYSYAAPNIKLNNNDNTFEISGVLHSKVVLKEGFYVPENSSPLVLAKNLIRKELPIGKFRTLCLEGWNMKEIRINGEVLEIVPEQEFNFTVYENKEKRTEVVERNVIQRRV